MYQSNQTGLRVAEEATPKKLPASPIWHPAEPNSYDDFGGEVKTVARAPIAADRQLRKGSVTDLDATAGFQTDFTTKSLASTIQGFMFATWRRKAEAIPTAVTAASYTVSSNGALFTVGSLLYAEGYSVPGNNGLKPVTASTGTSVSVAGLAVEATTTGTIVKVGMQGAAGDLALTVVGGKVNLNATALDLTTLGVIPGEWIWLGGDAAGSRYDTPECNGFYRVQTVAATKIVFDRAPENAVADAGAAKTIQVFLGQVLKNEANPALQVKRSYQFERVLSPSADKVEYVRGCVANTLKVDTKTADKLTASLAFIGLDTEEAQAVKAGARPELLPQTAFSSSTDYQRLRLTNETDGSSLAVFLTDLSIQVDNGVEADKAIGYIGGVDHSIGSFNVSGNVEAFFSSMTAVEAARTNANVSLDFGLVANVYTPGVGNQAAGWLIDIPSLDLGDARLKVEKDKKIKLPLSLQANAHASFNHTMLLVNFQYLPQIAI